MKHLPALALSILLMMLCLCASGMAEEVFAVTDVVSASQGVLDTTTDKNYLSVGCHVDGEVPVTITVYSPNGSMQYQRDYGVCSGDFRSEDIYLKLEGSSCTYQISVAVGDNQYTFPVNRIMGRLSDNEACSVGYPLSDITGADTWKSATIIDVNAVEGTTITMPIHASGAYTLGTAYFTVSGGQLTVTASLSDGIDGNIDKATVYVATNAAAAKTLGTNQFVGFYGDLGSGMDLGGTSYAAVYLRLVVSFDPTGVPGSPQVTQSGQDTLWQNMMTQTASEAVG